MATVDITEQAVVVEAPEETSVVEFSAVDVTVQVSDVVPVVEFATAIGSAGTTDHGALTGLGDDDHTQYFNNTRLGTYTGFDARYYLKTEIDAFLVLKSDVGHTHVVAEITDLDLSLYAQKAAAETISGQWTYTAPEFHLNSGITPHYWNGIWFDNYGPMSAGIWVMGEDYDGNDGTGYFVAQGFSNDGEYEPYFRFARGRGSTGAYAHLQAGDQIGSIRWATFEQDFGDAEIPAPSFDPVAQIRVDARTARALPSGDREITDMYFLLSTGTTLRNHMKLYGDGGLVFYDQTTPGAVEVTGGNMGPGTINAKGFYVDGVEITGGGGGAYEPALGNPPADGYVLASTASGTRSWTSVSAASGLDGGWMFSGDCGVITDDPAAAPFDCLLITEFANYQFDGGTLL